MKLVRTINRGVSRSNCWEWDCQTVDTLIYSFDMWVYDSPLKVNLSKQPALPSQVKHPQWPLQTKGQIPVGPWVPWPNPNRGKGVPPQAKTPPLLRKVLPMVGINQPGSDPKGSTQQHQHRNAVIAHARAITQVLVCTYSTILKAFPNDLETLHLRLAMGKRASLLLPKERIIVWRGFGWKKS